MRSKKFLTIRNGSICLILIFAVLSVMVACSGAPVPAPVPAPPPALAPPPAPAPEAELPLIELKVPWMGAPEDEDIQRDVKYEEEIMDKATGGRVKWNLYFGGSLVAFQDHYRALQEGIADFSFIVPQITPGVFPLHDLFSLPGLFSVNQATGTLVALELYKKYPQFEQEFSPDVKWIFTHVLLGNHLHTTEPVRSIADLKGKVIACGSKAAAKAFESLGASTTVLPFGELYTALERGVMDGVVCGWGAIDTYKLYEVVNYHTVLNISPLVLSFLFNRETFNKFTPQEQDSLELTGLWLSSSVTRKNNDNILKQEERWLGPGTTHEIIRWPEAEMAKMAELFRPAWDEWAGAMEAKGYPGRDILKDAESLLSSYRRG